MTNIEWTDATWNPVTGDRLDAPLRCPVHQWFVLATPARLRKGLGPAFPHSRRCVTGTGSRRAELSGDSEGASRPVPRSERAPLGADGEIGLGFGRRCERRSLRGFFLSWCRHRLDGLLVAILVAAVLVFVKQLGSKAGLRSSKGGDPSEWPEDLRVREFPGGGK